MKPMHSGHRPKRRLILARIAAFMLLTSGASVWADQTGLPDSLNAKPRMVSYPWMSLDTWYRFHADDVAQAEAGAAPLVFVGDSITEAWETTGKTEWDRHFAPRGAVNFGIGGDMTQNLLWRLDHGAVGKLDPAAVVLLIGVNNTYFTEDSPEVVASGIVAVTDKLESVFPNADILLLAVFPYGELPEDPGRAEVTGINQAIEHLGDRERVSYLDIGGQFVDDQGVISVDVMPDFLHLSETAYQDWAQIILPWIEARVPAPGDGP